MRYTYIEVEVEVEGSISPGVTAREPIGHSAGGVRVVVGGGIRLVQRGVRGLRGTRIVISTTVIP